jgi:hypothetical protein
MKFAYEPVTMRDDTLAVVDQANEIITEYARQGYSLTLRQLYYQFVSRDLLPNRQESYKRLGDIIVKGRLGGLVDWHAIEDRTRTLRSSGPYWDDMEQILRATPSAYSVDPWEDQDTRVEVWIEKDALLGVIEGVCNDLHVAYFSCRGYVSWSEMYVAAQRIHDRWQQENARTVILHLGDHDPSGVQMTEDIEDRLRRLWVDEDVLEVHRIALTMDQVEQYDPPPNPAKITDSRATSYIAEYGHSSWELDALEPAVLAALIEDHVVGRRDEDLFEAAVRREEEGREDLRRRVESIL